MSKFFNTNPWTDLSTGITWRGTGEVLDVISAYDWEEVVEGEDENGNIWTASATVSIGEIQEIYEPKLEENF